jgi:hypothetical protein
MFKSWIADFTTNHPSSMAKIQTHKAAVDEPVELTVL